MEVSDPMMKKKSSPPPSTAPMLWKVLAIVFIVISIALLIALIVVATRQQESDDSLQHESQTNQTSKAPVSVESCADGMTSSDDQRKSDGVFDDLTVDEITAVRDYLMKQASLNLTEYTKATVDSNYIYLIQLLPPSKHEVLEHLDNNGAKPERKAVAVVFHGASNPPVIREYIISAISNPTNHIVRKVPGGQKDSVPYNARPFDNVVELTALHDAIVKDASQELTKLMYESYDGYTYNCPSGKKCLHLLYTAPMGFTAEERYVWIFFLRGDATGPYAHPLDLMLLVDHGGADVSKWKIIKVLYNNQTFDTVDELAAKYENNTINKKSFCPCAKRQRRFVLELSTSR